jgi:hypothetical protein
MSQMRRFSPVGPKQLTRGEHGCDNLLLCSILKCVPVGHKPELRNTYIKIGVAAAFSS